MSAERPIEPARLRELVRDPSRAGRFNPSERITVLRLLEGRGPLGGPWAIPVLVGAAFALAVIGACVYAAAFLVPASSVRARAELFVNVGLMAEVLLVLGGWLLYQRGIGRDLRAALLGGPGGAVTPRLAQLLAFRRVAPRVAWPLAAICLASTTLGYFALDRARAVEINDFPGSYRVVSLLFALAAFVSLALGLLGWIARLYGRVLEKTRLAILSDAAADPVGTGGSARENGL